MTVYLRAALTLAMAAGAVLLVVFGTLGLVVWQ